MPSLTRSRCPPQSPLLPAVPAAARPPEATKTGPLQALPCVWLHPVQAGTIPLRACALHPAGAQLSRLQQSGRRGGRTREHGPAAEPRAEPRGSHLIPPKSEWLSSCVGQLHKEGGCRPQRPWGWEAALDAHWNPPKASRGPDTERGPRLGVGAVGLALGNAGGQEDRGLAPVEPATTQSRFKSPFPAASWRLCLSGVSLKEPAAVSLRHQHGPGRRTGAGLLGHWKACLPHPVTAQGRDQRTASRTGQEAVPQGTVGKAQLPRASSCSPAIRTHLGPPSARLGPRRPQGRSSVTGPTRSHCSIPQGNTTHSRQPQPQHPSRRPSALAPQEDTPGAAGTTQSPAHSQKAQPLAPASHSAQPPKVAAACASAQVHTRTGLAGARSRAHARRGTPHVCRGWRALTRPVSEGREGLPPPSVIPCTRHTRSVDSCPGRCAPTSGEALGTAGQRGLWQSSPPAPGPVSSAPTTWRCADQRGLFPWAPH